MTVFSNESTTEEVIAGISLAGQLAIVTGASSGLGVESARALAAAGAKVVMSGRDAKALEEAANQVRDQVTGAHVEILIMDLADLPSVRDAAQRVLTQYPSVSLLLNNAGVMACPMLRTAQGFEMQFGTNHLGHFLFTCLIAPVLVAGSPSRIINLSSAGHKFAPLNFDDPNYQVREYDKWQAYGESKTANVLFTVGLDERLRDRGVRAYAVHPGMIMTSLSRHLQEADLIALSERSQSKAKMVFKSVEQGAATSIWAATASEIAEKGGIYLENCQIADSAVHGSDSGVESYALDSASAQRLWALSEALVEQSFEI